MFFSIRGYVPFFKWEEKVVDGGLKNSLVRWSFRTLAENEPWLRPPPLCSRFFSTWCGRSGHGRPTPTERHPARKRRARERRSSAPSSKPSDSETKKVYSGRKKKFYFVFFVFFERHFRFFVRLYFCHRMLKWRGKSSSQENDDISLRLKKANQIDLNVPSCLSLSQLLLNTDFLFDSGCRAEKAERTHFFVKSKQTGWK